MNQIESFLKRIETGLTNNHVKLLVLIIKLQNEALKEILSIKDLSIPNLLNAIEIAEKVRLKIENILEKR